MENEDQANKRQTLKVKSQSHFIFSTIICNRPFHTKTKKSVWILQKSTKDKSVESNECTDLLYRNWTCNKFAANCSKLGYVCLHFCKHIISSTQTCALLASFWQACMAVHGSHASLITNWTWGISLDFYSCNNCVSPDETNCLVVFSPILIIVHTCLLVAGTPCHEYTILGLTCVL